MNEVVRLENIVKVFNQGTPDAFYALNNMDLTIHSGDFITIVGGNGAGKSTLLNTISGTYLPDAGQVYMDGQEITNLNEEERAKHISRVFQDPKMGTAPRMTVEENLALAELRGQGRGLKFSLTDDQRRRYQKQLTQLNLGLEKRLASEIGLLSGGQRQAVALLMATMLKPRVLLLDEHTAALDPKTSRRILELTNHQVVEERLTAMMITHNLQDALHYGNRMLVLHHGEIIHDFNQTQKDQLSTQDLYEMMEKLAIEDE